MVSLNVKSLLCRTIVIPWSWFSEGWSNTFNPLHHYMVQNAQWNNHSDDKKQ